MKAGRKTDTMPTDSRPLSSRRFAVLLLGLNWMADWINPPPPEPNAINQPVLHAKNELWFKRHQGLSSL